MTRKEARPGVSASVLVVESDQSELARVAGILREEGYDVHEADTFQKAVQSLQTSPTHVLLTTVRLGPYNGLHLIVRCRHARPDIGTILTHQEEDGVLRNEAVTNDAAFLLKPCSPETLTQAVASSLTRALH